MSEINSRKEKIMYYHILIEVNEKISNKNDYLEYCVFDLELEDVLKRIYIPYLQKESFIFSGYRLSYENIRRLMVSKTSEDSKKVLSKELALMSPGVLMILNERDCLFENEMDATYEVEEEAKRIIKERDK